MQFLFAVFSELYILLSYKTPFINLFFPVDAIRNGIDILVGTPGRIKDHIQNNKLNLTKVKHVVLDEVDQMLDMGFAEQVEEILGSSYKKGKVNLWVCMLKYVYRPKWADRVLVCLSNCQNVCLRGAHAS